MARVYDHWERLVRAALLREELRRIALDHSRSSSFASSSDLSSSARFDSPSFSESFLNFSRLGISFSYQQILQATANFSNENLIKVGHSSDIFLGIFEVNSSQRKLLAQLFTRKNRLPASVVAIKRVDLRVQKGGFYLEELGFYSRVSHRSFVPLLGHCLENEYEKFLVYKYMPNEDLSSSLFKKPSGLDDDRLPSLDWITRMKIAIGAAEALTYLHDDCNPPIVHGDVQASSILLDKNFDVRLGSLSQVGSQQRDIFPDGNRIGRSSPREITDDIYCFGKVLLELVTGMLGISLSIDATMKEWQEATLPYISIYDKEIVINIVDPSLIIDDDLLEEVWAMAIIARSCLNPKPIRPHMRHILKALENPLKVVRVAPGQH